MPEAILVPLAILVSAALALFCVLWQINQQRKLKKQTNSIQVMLALCSDKDLYDASSMISEIEDDPNDSSEKYAHSPPENLTVQQKNKWLKKRSALRAMVNFFETVSVGIRQNIYDEEIICGCARSMFIKNYERIEPFILKMRSKNNVYSYGEHFQHIAEKFRQVDPPP